MRIREQTELMHRLWKILKILLAVGIFLLVFNRPNFLPHLSIPVWIFALITIFVYGTSQLFSTKLPVVRRFAIAYLAFAGVPYLLAGAFGLQQNGELIEGVMSVGLISPYLLKSYFHTGFSPEIILTD